MTAVAMTFEMIEARAETSVGLAIFAKRMRDGIQALISGAILLPILSRKMDELACALKSGILDKLTDEQLNELADLLKQLNVLTAQIVNAENSPRILDSQLQKIEEQSEDFQSILENIYLALDPNFRKAVSSAIDRLHVGVEESATVLR